MSRHKWYSVLLLALVLVPAGSGVACQSAPPSAPPAQPVDATPPPVIAGLIATAGYDGVVGLSWEKSTAEDFAHYNIYAGKSEIADVAGRTPVHQITDIAANACQLTGLENGTRYSFAVTATDKNGNEKTRVACATATPVPMPRGTPDPDIHVDVYRSGMAWPGTTLLPDNHNVERPRIVEVNMLGEIVWEYPVPGSLKRHTNPGFDVEPLPNSNILFVLPKKGVYEIDRNGKIVWSYLDNKVTHDADRLPNGNTLVVCGGDDEVSQAQVKEIDPQGEVVWAWYAKDHFYKAPYKDIYLDGWTHANAVTRLANGNTLISLRNFNFVVEVDPEGSVVRTIGEGVVYYPHDPEALPSGNILVLSQPPLLSSDPLVIDTSVEFMPAAEIDPKTGGVVWKFMPAQWGSPRQLARDANRLPNGNTLITGTTEIVEVTLGGQVAWRLELEAVIEKGEAPRLGFYKAERIGIAAP